jgi:phenylacetate-CoA ligase
VPVLNLLKNMRRMKKGVNLEAGQVKILRERRFRSLLRHVLKKSKFYRTYYAEHGISADNIEGVRLEDLPMIDKSIMMEHYDDFVCDSRLARADLEQFISDPSNRGRKYRNSYQVIHTSGSSGTIGLFVYGPKDWDMLMALVLTRVSKTQISPFRKSKLAFIGATDGHFGGICLVQGAPRLLIDLLPLSINSPLTEICRKIDRFQPHAITGYSSGICLLAQEQIKGNINIHPQRIIGAADLLTSKMRQTIKEAFAVEPVNFYAASESIGMAADCDTHQGFHLFDDWHCFEIVDDDMQPVKPGEPGKLLLTNLYNYTQPLIRYQLRDEIVLDDRPCECGCPFPVIKSFAGRQEEFLWFEKPDGTREFIHPIVIVEFFVPGLEKLQIIQTERNRLLMKVMIRGNRDDALSAVRKRMTEILEGKGLERLVGFEVQVFDGIENDSQTGKFKLIIPLKQSQGPDSRTGPSGYGALRA